MKKTILLILAAVLLTITATAQEPSEIFGLEKITTQLQVSSAINITPTGQRARLSEFTADIYFLPKRDKHTTIKEFTTQPESSMIGDKLRFKWQNNKAGKLDYSYKTTVTTTYNSPEIHSRIKYPLTSLPKDTKKYTLSTQVIESNNAAIKKKAAELTKNSDDMYEAVTRIAQWVKENIKYDLSTLTAQASQKAGWVLAHRIGVCDEITSLFIAMLRSLGIPAKFISGIAYANSPNISEKWGAHGWAEVYYPGIGWVPYDVTFGEFGWLDAGHIKMMESTGPQEPSTKFEWKGKEIDVEVKDLEINATLISTGKKRQPDIAMSIEAEKKETGPGSYNLLKATIKNLRDYYITAEIGLAKVNELELNKEKQIVILKPKETRTITWVVKVKEDLNKNYIYTIPAIIYTIRNETSATNFTVQKNRQVYTKGEIEKLAEILKESDKSRSIGLDIACSVQPEIIRIGQTTEMRCILKNNRNTTIAGKYCFEGKDCADVMLKPQEKKEATYEHQFSKSGDQTITFTIKSDDITTRSVLHTTVLDEPRIRITQFKTTTTEKYGQDYTITFRIEKQSISTPKEVKLTVTTGGSKADFELSKLDNLQDIEIKSNTATFLRKKEKIKVKLTFKDDLGKEYSQETEFPVTLKKTTFWDRIRMFFRRIFG